MRLASVLLVLFAFLGLMPSVDSAPRFDNGYARITKNCDLEMAECDPTFTADAKTGRIRGDVSIATPAGGTAPGWGGVYGSGELWTRLQVTQPAKTVRYVVRVKTHHIVEDTISIGTGNGIAFVHADAQYSDCHTCQITAGSFEKSGGFKEYVELPVTITNRGKSVPAGEVSLEVQVEAGSDICCFPILMFYGPPFVFPGGPPGIGSVTSRINALVTSIKRV